MRLDVWLLYWKSFAIIDGSVKTMKLFHRERFTTYIYIYAISKIILDGAIRTNPLVSAVYYERFAHKLDDYTLKVLNNLP